MKQYRVILQHKIWILILMPRMLGIFSGREAQQFQDTVIIKKKVVKFGFLSERP